MLVYDIECDCDDCLNSDAPCEHDCEHEDPCQGCREAKQTKEELEFETDCALGRV